MENRRTVAQDAAKALMIIAVIFFHCFLMSFESPAEALSTFSILNACFPFVLSTFFFYAGYNYVPRGRTFKELVIRRTKQLLIPLVVCSIVSIICVSSIELAVNHSDIGATFQALGNSILYSLMSEPLALMIEFPQSGETVYCMIIALGLMWFLYCLFICTIFFYLLVEHTNKKLSTLVSVIIGLLTLSFCIGQFVGVYLPYSVQCYPLVLTIMLTASYLRQSHFLTKKISNKKDIIFHTINVVIAEGIVISVSLLAYYQKGAVLTGALLGGRFDPSLKGLDVPITYLFAIIGTYLIHTTCRIFRHIPLVGKSLQWIGQHCAIFYLFHPIPLMFVSAIIFQNKLVLGRGQAFVYITFIFAILIPTCLLLDFIIKKKHVPTPIKEEIDNNKDPEDD